jgi:NosR/NirI family nitrous oxide reductase transcriptional regulator
VKTFFALLIAALAIFSVVIAEAGPSRFPRPEFESAYQHPDVQHVSPRSDLLETIDVVALVCLMSLSAYFALFKRSRKGLFGIAVFSVIYFGFVRVGCICPVGSTQNIAAALFDPAFTLPVSVIAIFLLPLLFSLFFGRVFCGGVCPLGAVQDLVMLRPLTLPRWLSQALGTLPYLYLGIGVLLAATGSVFLICQYDPFVSFFRLGGNSSMMLYSGGFLVLSALIARPYCRFLCPYGVLLGWMSFLSSRRLRTNPENCLSCRLCEDACAMDCIDQPSTGEVKESRSKAKKRLAILLLVLPIAAAISGFLVSRLDTQLALLHPKAHLVERLRAEELGEVEGTTLASRTFRASGTSMDELFAEVAEITARFRIGGWWLGIFFAVVIMIKLITLSVYRTREEFQPNPVSCFSCGRCFRYCPQGNDRIQIEGVGN